MQAVPRLIVMSSQSHDTPLIHHAHPVSRAARARHTRARLKQPTQCGEAARCAIRLASTEQDAIDPTEIYVRPMQSHQPPHDAAPPCTDSLLDPYPKRKGRTIRDRLTPEVAGRG
jgi:hypothetical protein